MFFFTLTNRTKGVHLATAVSQQGTDVFHKADELKLINEEGQDLPNFTGDESEYFVHTKRIQGSFRTDCPGQPAADICQIHESCIRTPLSDYMPENQKISTVSKSLYNINRIYNETEKNLLTNIILSGSNSLKISYHHTMKEFGESTGWCHSHGLAWREGREEEVSVLHRKICAGEKDLSNEQLKIFALFCNTLVTASLDPQRIMDNFPDMSLERALDVTNLAQEFNNHRCTKKCHKEVKPDDCWYMYPICPSTETLIARPPNLGDHKANSAFLTKTTIVKESVRETLLELRQEGILTQTNLLEVLSRALGEIEETIVDNLRIFKVQPDTEFQEDSRLRELIFTSPYEGEAAVLHAVYMYCLTFNSVHKLVIQRDVQEVYTVQYEPHILEASRANHSMEIICNTVERVVDYVTKGPGEREEKKMAHDLHAVGHKDKSAQLLATTMDHREVTQSEAYFRIDPKLSLANTNLPVVFVNTKFPLNRSRNYEKARIEDEGVTINNLEGRYKKRDNILDKYQLFPEGLKKITPSQFAMNFKLATPSQSATCKEQYQSQVEIPNSRLLIAVTNDDREEEELYLPTRILLSNGTFMILATRPSVVDVPLLKPGSHQQQYSDLLLYTHWRSEEQDLGEALRDKDVCAAMHTRKDRNPMIGTDGRELTKIETVKARLNMP